MSEVQTNGLYNEHDSQEFDIFCQVYLAPNHFLKSKLRILYFTNCNLLSSLQKYIL